MKLGVLFSGGKDSTYTTYLAKKSGYNISCLITLVSDNEDSYMFHTPSITKTESQAKSMNIPLVIQKTKGEKESELSDLELAINFAKKKYKIQGIVTGAVESIYQASRIQAICDKLNLECFNPLWQKNQIELLEDLIKNKFEIIITGVAAYPLNESFIGKKIDKKFIEEFKKLNERYKISPSGEGGEFESFVLNCPLFKKKLEIHSLEISGSNNSFRAEVKIK